MDSRLVLVAAVALITVGCATHKILRDPQTGQTVNCTTMSEYQTEPGRTLGGAAGTGAARGFIEAFREADCIKSYESAGFVRIDGTARPVVATAGLAVKVGVQLRPDAGGLRVINVQDPAQKAGVRVNDVLLAVNGQRVRSTNDVVGVLRDKRPGDVITMTLDRGGQITTTETELAAR